MIEHIDISEFRSFGYLQEANRCFFHPLGLALEVIVEDDGTECLGGVWDYRGDPEGIYYNDGVDKDKAYRVQDVWENREPQRMKRLGFLIQPADDDS